jgi:hypothetical protein
MPLLLLVALAAVSTCQLGLEFVDSWCASLDANACVLPCLKDADLHCRFAGEVQPWMDPCFYLPDASCVFPCKLEAVAASPSLLFGDTPPPPVASSSSPPPPGHAACTAMDAAPYLVEHWWERQCAAASTAEACAAAGKYCEWRVG